MYDGCLDIGIDCLWLHKQLVMVFASPIHTEETNNRRNEIGGKNTRHNRSYGYGIEPVEPKISTHPKMESIRVCVRLDQRQGITYVEDTGSDREIVAVGKEWCPSTRIRRTILCRKDMTFFIFSAAGCPRALAIGVVRFYWHVWKNKDHIGLGTCHGRRLPPPFPHFHTRLQKHICQYWR